ncbi:serine hydrolase [Cellulophaga sp. L1A9]|uniref:serine hydrolase n=1 Tax=Cellulophaga sp. L1A9 TaxID=2686362 RepID=UPI00131D93EB|nr:serine hydrolase [Cellulophaga sp. L1A9]
MLSKPISIIFFLLLIISCKEKSKIEFSHPIESALKATSPKIKNVIDSINAYEVQIKFTQIRRENNEVFFTDYDFQTNKNNYFYPASTVKLPVAILALEEINKIPDVSLHTKFYIEGDTIETTVAKEITKIFAVSDNDAYNRLFEFLGQDTINQSLHKKGIENVRISHRLSIDDADNITTKPIVIYMNDSTTRIRERRSNATIKPLVLNNLKKGKGYINEDDELLKEPFDFSFKNYYSIDAQHEVLKRIIFPEKFKKEERFNLSATQRDFLLNAMHTLPREARYDSTEYYDSYVKFFMFGDHQKPIPNTIEIYNKVGYAYGTLTDCAYIRDSTNTIEFLLTATILVNNNQIFNDNTYEYDTIGIPFLAELGRQLYDQELQQKKQ